MLRGEIIGLRAQQDSDIEISRSRTLANEVETRARSDSRPWWPVTPGSADSPYRGPAANDNLIKAVNFSAIELATGELIGEASLWGIDLHNRRAHIGYLPAAGIPREAPGHQHRPRAVPLRLRRPRPAPAAGRHHGRQRRDDRRRYPGPASSSRARCARPPGSMAASPTRPSSATGDSNGSQPVRTRAADWQPFLWCTACHGDWFMAKPSRVISRARYTCSLFCQQANPQLVRPLSSILR